MGWAIQQPDGTYRGWNANTKDDSLLPGETWVFFTTPPLLNRPTPPPNPLIALLTAALADPTVPPSLKAILAAWRSQL